MNGATGATDALQPTMRDPTDSLLLLLLFQLVFSVEQAILHLGTWMLVKVLSRVDLLKLSFVENLPSFADGHAW